MIRMSCFNKMGDIMYALPAVRAMARLTAKKVHLVISGYCWQMVPLLWEQPYIGEVDLEDVKPQVEIHRGAIFPDWEWFKDGNGFNLSLQPDFFKDDAPISWTRCYMNALGIEGLEPADCTVLPSLVNHRRWMTGVQVDVDGKRQETPRTIVIAPETDTLDELSPGQWQQVVDRVADANYQPVIVGVRRPYLLFNCLDLRGQTTVPVLARVIADSRGFIGAHSFPWHIARHSETPAVCLQTWREGLRRCLPIDTSYTWLTPEEWELAVPSVLGLHKPKEVFA